MLEHNDINTMIKITNSAIILFDRKGFAGASISDISKQAGLSKGILYYYFKNKDELYLYCAKKCIEDFKSYLAQNITEVDNNEHILLEFLKLRLRFFNDYPVYRNFFINIIAKNPEHLSAELTKLTDTFQEENINFIIRYIDKMRLGKGIVKEDILSFISLLQNYAALTINIENGYKKQKEFLKIATIFINGLTLDIE